MKKTFNILSLSLFVLYFLFIGCVQVYDLQYFNSNTLQKIKEKYALPFFEQNWSMFSPNPPSGNHIFMLKFSTKTKESNYIDINRKIRERSFSRFFSIDQRIKKYFSGCFNDILDVQKTGVNLAEHIHKSQGLESLLNYAVIVFENQVRFKSEIQPHDSVFVHIYLVDEQLNKDITKRKTYTTIYSEIDPIYLLKND